MITEIGGLPTGRAGSEAAWSMAAPNLTCRGGRVHLASAILLPDQEYRHTVASETGSPGGEAPGSPLAPPDPLGPEPVPPSWPVPPEPLPAPEPVPPSWPVPPEPLPAPELVPPEPLPAPVPSG